MEILLTVIFTLAGIAVGSFLNVCIDRLPLGKSLVSPRSHCESCQHQLSLIDMVPVISYLWLRGHCRYCQARVPLRILLVEICGGVIFFLSYWRFVLSADNTDYSAFVITAFWGCVFLIIIFIDWEYHLILNRVTYPAAVVALIILGINSLLPEPGILRNLNFLLEPNILSGIIGGAIGFAFFLIVFLINPKGMGIGDIKLAGLIGLVTGFPLVIVALLIGIFMGGLVAIVLLSLRIKGRKDVIPYGAFLGLGPIVVLLWGNEIFNWYLDFF